ncbi:hypothetical protein [Streptomyces sp. NPDC048612]|uniref:hypothetical protein n=1 Tax=Streptomyces sp. NPDC048612 TaxID=3365579 RepID=UPI00371DB7EC
MTGNHDVVEVEHAESGASGHFDNRLLGHQLQLMLCCVHTMLADRDVTVADAFRTKLAPGKCVPGLSECREVFHAGGAQCITLPL